MLKNCFTEYLAPDEDFSFGADLGAEEPEVAEPVSEEGAEDLELAEPEQGRSEADAAFAEMRRARETAEQELLQSRLRMQELEAQNRQMVESLGLYFDGENPEDLSIAARAHFTGVDPETERANFQMQNDLQFAQQRNEALERQLMDIKVEQAMASGLSEIRQIDPNVERLEDLGDEFATYIAAGLSSVDAYYAVKAREIREKKVPPQPIGTVTSHSEPSGFFTKEEVDAMSDAEVDKNFDAIMRSMSKWK